MRAHTDTPSRRLTRENDCLKKQLAEALGQNKDGKAEMMVVARTESCAEQGESQPPSSISAEQGSEAAALSPRRTPMAAIALATVFAVGLLFAGVDLRPEQLPVRNANKKTNTDIRSSSSLAAYQPLLGREGRAGGRVLLGASGDYGWQGQAQGMSDKKQLLIVTLLDHLVSGHKVSAPSLLGRLCRRLQEMNVLDDCNFMDSMDKV